MRDVLYLHRLVGAPVTGDWVRPSDWLPMPATAANQVDVLCAVFDDDANYVAVKAATSTGTYTVDWGDGTIDTGIASNVQCNHVYTYSSISSSTNCSRGYRQAMVKITPATGDLTGVNLDAVHPTVGSNPSRQWLDVQLNAPSCTSFIEQNARMLERCNIVAIGLVTNANNMHNGCYSLHSITYPAGSLASLTNASYMHQNCYSLQSITYPAGSLASLTNADYMHQNCTSLQSITYPAGSLASLTNAANMHSNCYSLAKITNCAVPITFSVANAKLSAAALDAIYTALPTVTSQTITVSGNFGTSSDDPSIATAKGWTVTG